GVELPPEVPLDELERYLGRYRSEEMDETLLLEIKDNSLALNIPGQKLYPLRAPDEEGRWYFRVVDFIFVSFEESEDGRVLSMIYNERGHEIKYQRIMGEGPLPERRPTLEEIFALQQVDQRKAAIKALGAYQISGTVRMEQAGLEGRFTWSINGPQRFRMDLDFNLFGVSRVSLFSDMAWSEAPHGLITELKGRFHAYAKRAHPEVIFGDWRCFFDEFMVLRQDEHVGRKVVVVKAKGGDAPDFIFYVDAENGDLLKTETQLIAPGSVVSLPVSIVYDDYRESHGLRLPHRITNSHDATGRMIMEIKQIRTGLKVNDLFFLLMPPPGVDSTPLNEEQKRLNLESFDMAWNLVRDGYWDPGLEGLDWEAVCRELRPRMERARTRYHAHMILNDLVMRLGVSHFGVESGSLTGEEADDASESAEMGVTGIELRAVDGHALVVSVTPDSAADQAGIRPGWEILDVDGVDIRAKLERADRNLEENSTKPLLMTYAVVPLLTGKINGSVTLVLLDGSDEMQERTLTLGALRGQVQDFGHLTQVDVWVESRIIEEKVGYIAFSRFFDPVRVMKVFNESMRTFMDLDGIIIDVRGNPGGLPEMAKGMIGWFISEKNQVVGTMYSREQEIKHIIQPRARTYSGPVVVLVDGLSGSSSEFFAAALQDLGRARIFGSRTKGELVNASFVKLPNNDLLFYADSKYVTVTGRCIEGQGVIPDEVVYPSRDALLKGKDTAIEAAKEWILTRK
ncbi:MAG: S41 family peptidase, partial [Planctomycetota bacterium]